MKCSNNSAVVHWMTASFTLACGVTPWLLPESFTPRYLTSPMKLGVTFLSATVAYSQIAPYLSPSSGTGLSPPSGTEREKPEDLKYLLNSFYDKKKIDEKGINKLPKRINGVLPDVVGHPAYRELSFILHNFVTKNTEKLTTEINKYLDSILNPSPILSTSHSSGSDYMNDDDFNLAILQVDNSQPVQDSSYAQEERKKIVKQLILFFRDPRNQGQIDIFFGYIARALDSGVVIAEAIEAAILELKKIINSDKDPLPSLPTQPPRLTGEKGLAAAYLTYVGVSVCEDLVVYFKEKKIQISEEQAKNIILYQLGLFFGNSKIESFAKILTEEGMEAERILAEQTQKIQDALKLPKYVHVQEAIDYIFRIRDTYPQCIQELARKQSIDELRSQLDRNNECNYSSLLRSNRIQKQITALQKNIDVLDNAIKVCDKKVTNNLQHILVKLEDRNLPIETKQRILTDLVDKLGACQPTWVEVSRSSLEEIYSCAETGENVLLRMAKQVREAIVLQNAGDTQWHVLNWLRGQSDFNFGLDSADIEEDPNKDMFNFSGNLSSFRTKCLDQYTPKHLIEAVHMQLLYRSGTETNLLQQEVLCPYLEQHSELCQGKDPLEWMIANCLEKRALGKGVAYVINPLGVGYMLEAIGLIK